MTIHSVGNITSNHETTIHRLATLAMTGVQTGTEMLRGKKVGGDSPNTPSLPSAPYVPGGSSTNEGDAGLGTSDILLYAGIGAAAVATTITAAYCLAKMCRQPNETGASEANGELAFANDPNV